MHWKILLNGASHPDGWDFFRIEDAPDGKYQLSGCRAQEGSAKLGPAIFDTAEQAETAGRQWAIREGATIVYVERAFRQA